MRHDVKGKIERSAPDMLDFRIAQLRINADHALTQEFGAIPYGAVGFREKRGAAPEEHAIVGSEPVIVQKMLGVVDHAVAGAEFARQVRRQRLGGNDVGTDGDDFLAQRRSCGTGVGAAREQNLLCSQTAARSFHEKAASAGDRLLAYAEDPRVVKERGASAVRGLCKAGDVLSGIYAGTCLVHQCAEINVRANFLAKLGSRNDAQLVVEFALDAGSRFGKGVEVSLLAGDFEMPAAGEAAGDSLLFHDLFDEVDGLERSAVHALYEFTAIARNERGNRQLHSGENHAAVAAACSPARGFCFENGGVHTAFAERAGGGKSAEAGSDDGYIDALGKRLAHIFCRFGNRPEPVVRLFNGHESVGGILAPGRMAGNAALGRKPVSRAFLTLSFFVARQAGASRRREMRLKRCGERCG